jgi:hypothetical protein
MYSAACLLDRKRNQVDTYQPRSSLFHGELELDVALPRDPGFHDLRLDLHTGDLGNRCGSQIACRPIAGRSIIGRPSRCECDPEKYSGGHNEGTRKGQQKCPT